MTADLRSLIQAAPIQGEGLHERAIAAALALTEVQPDRCPDLDQVAQALSADRDELAARFTDGQAVLLAAVEQALLWLMDACTRAVVKVDPKDPVAQFVALGVAYVDWAARFRQQFLMISNGRLVDIRRHPDLARYAAAVHDLMRRMLQRARDDGRVHADEDLEMMMLSSRIFIYGLARRLIEGRIESQSGEPLDRCTAHRVLRDFVTRYSCSAHPACRNRHG